MCRACPSSSRTSLAHRAGVTQRFTQNERFTPMGIVIFQPTALAYLVAPMVRPRTMWRETTRAKTVTGSTITVPVAMILPQGSS